MSPLGGDDHRSDTELILVSRDDAGAFRVLYDRHSAAILSYFYRRTFDAHAAADLTAETFAVAFERRGRYRPQGPPGVAWLYGIARRELAGYRRKGRIELRAVQRLGVQLPTLDEESIEQIEAQVDNLAYRRLLEEALGRLSVGQRRAVQLRVADDLDYRSVATKLGCSEATARVRVHRGLTRLADFLEVTR